LKYINDQIQKLDDLVNWIKAKEGKAKKWIKKEKVKIRKKKHILSKKKKYFLLSY